MLSVIFVRRLLRCSLTRRVVRFDIRGSVYLFIAFFCWFVDPVGSYARQYCLRAYFGRDFRSVATALAATCPPLSDFRCALSERRSIQFFPGQRLREARLMT